MSFGKPGRPPEDRLSRQQEIFEAVSPLILKYGAKDFSMREAAHAACVSIGGLYHYFPTKRSLLFHGLDLAARDRICRDFRELLATFATWRPDDAIEAYLEHSRTLYAFVRPSVRAALELGSAELQQCLDQGFTRNVDELAQTLRLVAPHIDEAELAALGRTIRRIGLGSLLDAESDLDEVIDEIRAVIDGYVRRGGKERVAASA